MGCQNSRMCTCVLAGIVQGTCLVPVCLTLACVCQQIWHSSRGVLRAAGCSACWLQCLLGGKGLKQNLSFMFMADATTACIGGLGAACRSMSLGALMLQPQLGLELCVFLLEQYVAPSGT